MDEFVDGIKVLTGPFDTHEEALAYEDRFEVEDFFPNTLNPSLLQGFSGKWYWVDLSERRLMELDE